jgi:hypothetical protein
MTKRRTEWGRVQKLWCAVVVIAACAMVGAGPAWAQAAATTQARDGGIDAAEERKIAETVASSGAPSVSVAVVEHGKLTYAKAFGKAALEPARVADAKTRYAMGSISKQFTVAAIYHGGEVSGFLAYSYLYPTRDVAVIICSNQDGTDLITPLEQEIARWVMEPEKRGLAASMGDAPRAELDQVQGIVEGLQAGKINRALFTANANFYFTDLALGDFKDSLAPLGKLKSVTRRYAVLRGGMKARGYTAQFETKAVTLSIYMTDDGLYEQFLVVEDF